MITMQGVLIEPIYRNGAWSVLNVRL